MGASRAPLGVTRRARAEHLAKTPDERSTTTGAPKSVRSEMGASGPGQQEQLAAEALADLAMAGGLVGAQPIVSAKRAAHTKHTTDTNTRWLARWLPLSGRLS